MLLKKLYLFFISLFIFGNLFAQIDSNQAIETDAFGYEPEKESNKQQNLFDNTNTSQNQGDKMTLFGSLNDISGTLPKYKIGLDKKNISMLNPNKLDKDVLVKKYWNGKDISEVKIETKVSLGRLETSSNRIRIECRDYSYVDGDRVRLYVNEKVLHSNIILYGGYYSIDVDLTEGFNRIDIEALNQGISGPNTAQFKVIDEKGNVLADQEWNILTGHIATLVVMKI